MVFWDGKRSSASPSSAWMRHKHYLLRNKKIPAPPMGNKDRMDILRYHLACRLRDHLSLMPTHQLPHNAGNASEDTQAEALSHCPPRPIC